jgi:hypothetical protein
VKRAAIDVILFVILCIVTWGLLQLRGDSNRRVELNHGEVYYSPRVSFEEAMRCANYMVRVGVFDGNPRTMQLSRSNGEYELKMVASPQFLKHRAARQQAMTFARRVCDELFLGEPVAVHLADDELQTMEVLFRSQPGPPNH